MRYRKNVVLLGWIAYFIVPAASVYGSGTPLATDRIASGLAHPVYVTHAPNDFDRIFILEKRGLIKVMDLDTENITTFMNIDSRVGGGTSTNDERGLLGLAFHPDYENNGFFYVNYTNNSGDTTISRFSVQTGNPNAGDPNSEMILLTIIQPYSNHNGGWLEFGPNDGYLYIGTGDGGSANDPGNRAQDITNQLLGKLLRIDVDGGSPYGIPPDNPFVGITGDDEIWAYGLRNPWRPSFDRETGDLYIADVGQNAREEIDFQRFSSRGRENYGWRCMEGNLCTGLSGCTCNSPSLTYPIHEYPHPVGHSITGGYVYRGCAIPDLLGTYFFADYVIQHIWSFTYESGNVTNFTERTAELSPSNDGFVVNQIASFGEDAAGEIYIVDQGSGSSGQIFKIIADAPPQNDCNNNGVPDECDIFNGTSEDCQPNGIPDECDITAGTSDDCDGNGVPDECDRASYGDVNGDGTVDLNDLICMLDGMRGLFTCPGVGFENLDIHPCAGGNGDLNLYDLFAILDALAGQPACPEPCP